MDYSKALELKQQGVELREIMQKLNISMNYKAFQKALWRYESSMDSKDTLDIKSELLKLLSKDNSTKELADKLNTSERVINAYIEDLKEEGYNITDIEGKFRLSKDIINIENEHEEDWQGNEIIKFGVVSDTHLCSKWQQLTHLKTLYNIFEHEGINTVYHCGDLSEGVNMRTGHEYEVFAHGVDEQAKYIIENYPKVPGMVTKFITGNHDHSGIKSAGCDIGYTIARERKDMIYLGKSNAKINLTPNCIMEINHPLDGASYATSYALQKLIDSLSGGEKPNVLFNGHHHKQLGLFYRNIHAFEAGTFQAQTPWMKGKRLAANLGGYVIELRVDKNGTIQRCTSSFIPFYDSICNDW